MTKTQWLSGITDEALLPFVANRLPTDVVSTSYITIEHETPSGVEVTGYVDTGIIKGFNTKLKYMNNSLNVYINGELITGITETGESTYTVTRTHRGYMTVSYVPQLPTYLYGSIDTKSDLEYTTNPVLRFIDIRTQMIDQMRYAINKAEESSGIQQSRWCGGFYSDNFTLAEYDVANDEYRSNLKVLITEITPQLLYELIEAISSMSSSLGVQLGESYDTNKIYSKLGIEYAAVEYIRRQINKLEASIEV